MPKKTRKGKKTHSIHPHARKSHKTNTTGVMIISVPSRQPLQMFPDIYKCKAKMVYAVNLVEPGTSSNITSITMAFKMNSFSTNNVSVVGGAYSSGALIVPAGAYYLIGDPNQGGNKEGGNAPYEKYRVTSSTIKVTTHQCPNAAGTQGAVIVQVVPNNSNNPNILDGYKGASYPNISEQPYCKTKSVPFQTENKPTIVTSRISMRKLYGDRFRSTLENGQYDAVYNTDPTLTCQWLLFWSNMSASGTNYAMNLQVYVEMWYQLEFFERNTYIDTANA